MQEQHPNNSICILTSVHSCRDVRIYVKEARSLAKNGYPLSLLSPNGEGTGDFGIRLLKIKPIPNRVLRILLSPFRMIKPALAQKAAVYHFHDPELIFTGLFLKLCKKKVIYDVHEDVPRQILNKHWIQPALRKWIAHLFEGMENFCARRFDAVITATPVIEERFIRKRCKTVTVNNYPILEEFADSDADWDQKEDRVCYIGGITKVRGIVELVEAIGLSRANLELAGTFDSEDLKKQVTATNAWKKVLDYGFVGRKEVAEILSRVKAGVVTIYPIPNYLESLPIKMFEYMAAGIPVIASNFPYWQGIFTEGECGYFVDPQNPQAIAEAIDRILENPDASKTMGQKGKALVYEKYNWAAEEKKLLELYKKIMEQ